MALQREQENAQNRLAPPTEGSLAVDPRAAIPAAPIVEPIPFPGRRRTEPTEPPTQVPGVGRRRFLGGLLAAATGTGLGLAGYNPVQSFLGEFGRLVSAEAPNFFDNKARGGSIGKNNTMAVSAEAANGILAKEKSEGRATDTTLSFPFILPDGSKQMGYGFQTRSKGFDPKTGKNIVEDMRSWMLLPKVPGRTIVVAPVDAEVFAFIIKKTGMIEEIGMEFTANGKIHTLKIGGTTLEGIFKNLTEIPDVNEYLQRNQKKHVKRWTPLLELMMDKDLQISLTSTPVGSSKDEENSEDINFLTTSDEAGIRKLVVLSN